MSEEQKSSSKSDDKKSAPVPAPRKLTKRKNLEKLKISAPYDFRHVAHLGIDSGPSDLKNLSKIDEIDSHLQEKDALQNLEAAAAGLHVPSWSSEVLEDKQAQDDDMTESKRAAVKPVSKEHRPQSTAKVEAPAEKHPPSSKLKEQPENSSPQGKKELAKASTQSTEESAKPAVQHTEKATKSPVQQKQESVKTSIHSVEKPEKSLTQRTDKPEKSSVQHKKEPSVSYLHRTKELEETSLQNTTNSQRPSSSQQNEPIYSVIR
ncbi:p21-Rho-binding domain protein [Oesophagostomum dentatum]|uniref:p21-Rho-binding domain protein n=1 Tax=Oesophagostomum dentatum TaxID=61180 RepID=A0A0B1TDD4_OESDE|nr:p21-Rho-binding domain protein [Oesophagostomum dentatum]